MKVAFFLDNRHIPGIDFSHPDLGNPGSGACEYLHVAIPFFIRKYCGPDVETIILAPFIDKLPSSTPAYQVGSVIEAATKAKELGVNFFVFRPRLKEEENILDHIDRIGLPSIGRAALTPTPAHVRKMARTKFFKALVCVGREQYDFLMDTPLGPKLAYIDNGIHVPSCAVDVHIPDVAEQRVVYMGALVPMKGFHQLAEAWPEVLRQCPEAKLSVIGSVKMYGDKLTVGPLGVASEEYERNHIMPFLCDANGRLHPSVTFHGQLGQEKFSVIHRAAVGVVNPTGQTETCCVSAVEMSACGVPVATGAYYALLDTVLHNKTGLLGRGPAALAKNICTILKNPEKGRAMGQAGYQRALSQYDFSAVAVRWSELFRTLTETGAVPKGPSVPRNILYHYKVLRLVNWAFQNTLGRVMPWPSVYELQEWAHARLRALRSR